MKIQIYGERASGTNYLTALITRNIPELELKWEYGWKHFFPDGDLSNSQDTIFFVIHRNIFDYLRSFYNRQWHVAYHLRALPFLEWMQAEWECVYDKHTYNMKNFDKLKETEMMFERDPDTGERFKNVFQMRRKKILVWDDLKTQVDHVFYLNYENLVSSAQFFIDSLAGWYGFKKKERFDPITGDKGGMNTYNPKKYKMFTDQQLSVIRTETDWDAEKTAGYSGDTFFTGKI